MTTTDMYLDESQTAFRLGVKITTLKRWREQGISPKFNRVDKKYVYLKEDLKAFEKGRIIKFKTNEE